MKSIDDKFKKIIIENSGDNLIKKKIERDYVNTTVVLSSNIGFGSAVNLGVKNSQTSYVFSINPDVTLKENTIKELHQGAEGLKDDFSILAPVDYEKNLTKPVSAAKVRGHSLFINKKKFEQIGGFDENFFIYFEEDDLCKRFKNNNEKIYLIPAAQVNHIGGHSHNKEFENEMEISRNWHLMWSMFYYHLKHYGPLKAYSTTFPFLIRSAFKALFYFWINKNEFKKYNARFKGLINSYLRRKSWYRPNLGQ